MQTSGSISRDGTTSNAAKPSPGPSAPTLMWPPRRRARMLARPWKGVRRPGIRQLGIRQLGIRQLGIRVSVCLSS
jgi:hypothetical protein